MLFKLCFIIDGAVETWQGEWFISVDLVRRTERGAPIGLGSDPIDHCCAFSALRMLDALVGREGPDVTGAVDSSFCVDTPRLDSPAWSKSFVLFSQQQHRSEFGRGVLKTGLNHRRHARCSWLAWRLTCKLC